MGTNRMATAAPHVVKSTARTLAILEFFDEHQRPANVVTVAAALDYPQSSTSALLRSLVALGYLQFDARARTYSPTDRVPLLGSWISPSLFRDAALPRMMKSIQERTRTLVLLAARNDDHAQYIHVLTTPGTIEHHIKIGMKRPLATSGVGLALLSAMSDKEVGGIFHRLNAYAALPAETVKIPELLASLGTVRRIGFAYSENRVVQGYGMIGIHIPPALSARPLVIGIGGGTERLRAMTDDVVRIVGEEMKAFLGQGSVAEREHAIRMPILATTPRAAPVIHPMRYRAA